jgi:hypothetical protein
MSALHLDLDEVARRGRGQGETDDEEVVGAGVWLTTAPAPAGSTSWPAVTPPVPATSRWVPPLKTVTLSPDAVSNAAMPTRRRCRRGGGDGAGAGHGHELARGDGRRG